MTIGYRKRSAAVESVGGSKPDHALLCGVCGARTAEFHRRPTGDRLIAYRAVMQEGPIIELLDGADFADDEPHSLRGVWIALTTDDVGDHYLLACPNAPDEHGPLATSTERLLGHRGPRHKRIHPERSTAG